MLTVYGLSHCTTTQKAIKYLETKGVKIDNFMDIRDTPPNVQTLQLLLNDKKMSIRSIMNTSGELYRSMGLKDKIDSMSESELLKLLSENGMLIKRPLITDGRRATVSAKESVLNTWIA